MVSGLLYYVHHARRHFGLTYTIVYYQRRRRETQAKTQWHKLHEQRLRVEKMANIRNDLKERCLFTAL